MDSRRRRRLVPFDALGSSSRWVPCSSVRRAGHLPLTGKVDERANEPGAHPALHHRTTSSLHGCKSISRAPSVAAATPSRRAVGHVGRVPRTDRRRAKPVASPTTAYRRFDDRWRAGRSRDRSPASYAIADTHRVMRTYEPESGSAFTGATVPNARHARSSRAVVRSPVGRRR